MRIDENMSATLVRAARLPQGEFLLLA
jgi:hypothetical protein